MPLVLTKRYRQSQLRGAQLQGFVGLEPKQALWEAGLVLAEGRKIISVQEKPGCWADKWVDSPHRAEGGTLVYYLVTYHPLFPIRVPV